MIQELKNLYHLLVAIWANLGYGFPSRKLKVIGVTGTDGKTTTATLIYEILKASGFKAALISTVSAKIGDQEMDTGLHTTTPDSMELQRLISLAVKRKTEYLVLEATSHGLDQNRLWGIKFLSGVITNVTHEHLDYHRTMENYLKAKAKLFKNVQMAVLNRDDFSYNFLNSQSVIRNAQIVTYSLKNKADFTPQTFKFKTILPGEHNQYNCLAAIAVTSSLEVAGDKIRRTVTEFRGVKGRMQAVNEGQNFKAIVDFSHTPNGLENALKTLRALKKPKTKLIVVFGCAGLRDKRKRPLMGEIAARLADVSVFTAEDPRTEDVNEIIAQMVKGALKADGVEGKTFFRVPDRQKAIDFAVSLAKKGDIVVTCGKGHEQSMCFGTKEYPWDDEKALRKALKNAKT